MSGLITGFGDDLNIKAPPAGVFTDEDITKMETFLSDKLKREQASGSQVIYETDVMRKDQQPPSSKWNIVPPPENQEEENP